MEKQDTLLQIHLERPIYEQETLNEDYHYEKPKTFDFHNALNDLNIKTGNHVLYLQFHQYIG